MKTKIILSIVVLSLVLITKSAFAENETATGTPKAVRNEIKEERQVARVTTTQIREEKKSVLSELKLKSSTAIYNAIKMGLEKKHAALLKIKAKLDARIAKNPMKKDTAGAVAKLAGFKTVEDQYILDLAALDAKFTEITTSGTTTKFSKLVSELKIAANVVKKDLNDMKKILRDATVALAQAPKLEVTKAAE